MYIVYKKDKNTHTHMHILTHIHTLHPHPHPYIVYIELYLSPKNVPGVLAALWSVDDDTRRILLDEPSPVRYKI